MTPLKIALLQLLPSGSPEGQLQKGLEACRRAKEQGADLALFPEMWSCGYSFSQEEKELRAAAIPAEGPFVQEFCRAAGALDMAIGITFLERCGAAVRNTLCLIDRHGERRLLYAKVHTCDFGDERVLTPGEDFVVTGLDTAKGQVMVGAMICYDREFPESARILMLKGAELILVPNACPMEINRLAQLRGRAYENMLAIATVNYPKGQPDCNGHSTLFDGVVYLPGETDSRDMLCLDAGEAEGIYIAQLDLDRLRAYRACEVHGNAYRRPELYRLLLEERVLPPFIRPDRRTRNK